MVFSGCSSAAGVGADGGGAGADDSFDLVSAAADESRSLDESALSLLSVEAPGVLGVPKDAKAPEPRPKALEAPEDGEDTPADRGEMALKGLERA